ncbi:MAG: divalent-cation tolerance protein CutA [bacterium]
MDSGYLVVYTTTANRPDADRLASALIEKRLAACAQVEGPITSTYWWQGRLEKGEEWKCSFKTSAACYQELEAELTRIHPYETPEILAVAFTQGSRDYFNWMDAQLRQPESC